MQQWLSHFSLAKWCCFVTFIQNPIRFLYMSFSVLCCSTGIDPQIDRGRARPVEMRGARRTRFQGRAHPGHFATYWAQKTRHPTRTSLSSGACFMPYSGLAPLFTTKEDATACVDARYRSLTPCKPHRLHQTASAVHRTAFMKNIPGCDLPAFTGKVTSAMRLLL